MTLHTALENLTASLPEAVLRAGDPAYEDAVLTLTGRGSPELVVRPRTTSEVAAAVRVAREDDLRLTVRSGGHSIAGLSGATEGLLLDLRGLDRVDVDPQTRTVRVGGGATWGPVARALEPFGLALTSGDTASVGVGGLTLGGGIGWMVRQHGLAIDNLVGAEVVTADGQVRQVSEDQDPELFWALRGGGGGCGVVTRFDFRAQEVPVVVHGTVTTTLEDPFRLLGAWRDRQQRSDERLTTVLTLLPAMQDRPATAMLGLCFTGTRSEADPVVEPLLELGTVLSNDIAERPYSEVLADHGHGGGEVPRLLMRSTFLPALGDEALADVAAVYAAGPTMVSLRGLGGAFGRVPADATAFAHRSAEAMVMAMRMVPDGEDPVLAAVPAWQDVARHGTGAYVNFTSTATADDMAAAYPAPTLERLARIAAAVDPDGLFGGARP